MKKQSPKDRVKNFNEVALGMSEEEAVKEATRCLFCKEPKCSANCPVEIDIPRFIEAIKNKKFDEAIKIVKEKNNLPGVCGRVCPQEDQCEAACVLNAKGKPINIGVLERFAADWELNNITHYTLHITQKRDSKIAVIGSGPAGLTCAGDLARLGYQVIVFEALHTAGGVLVYGIPEFRLPKEIVKKEIEYLKSLGVEVRTNFIVGINTTLKELFAEGYKVVFVGTGAGLPSFMKIPGENLDRVYSSNELLTRANLMKAYLFPEYDTPINIGKKVAVIGGGNTAMDSARVSLRLGAEKVFIIYRRSEKEMPARQEEIENAKEEGIELHMLTLPKKIIGDDKGFVKAMECVKMELGEPDSSGRRRPITIKGSEFVMDVDTVVVAIGQSPNPVFLKATPELKLGKWDKIEVDPNTQATNVRGVYAGGDATLGDDTVIAAMGAGKRAARAIHNSLT
ncbi:MAG: NADPH-dependent glutamate synthase [Candidatus Omnitrophica bacterium]|nr:NADPH-dependent glutamate synthase [Candidatus Omnitrophota bacterium]MBU4589491.1 NADPH-dependent glutamate synthase [Candidatus Omnitrophota bacterium]